MHEVKNSCLSQSCAAFSKSRALPVVGYTTIMVALLAIYGTLKMGPLRNLSRPAQISLITFSLFGAVALAYPIIKNKRYTSLLVAIAITLFLCGLLARLNAKGFTSFSPIAADNMMVLGAGILVITLIKPLCYLKIPKKQKAPTASASAPKTKSAKPTPKTAQSKKKNTRKKTSSRGPATAQEKAAFLKEFDQTLEEGQYKQGQPYNNPVRDKAHKKIIKLLRQSPIKPDLFMTQERYEKLMWIDTHFRRTEAFQTEVISIFFREKKDVNLLRRMRQEDWANSPQQRNLDSRYCEVLLTSLQNLDSDLTLRQLPATEVSTLCLFSLSLSLDAIRDLNYWKSNAALRDMLPFRKKENWMERIEQLMKLASYHFDSPNDEVRADVENMVIHLIKIRSHSWVPSNDPDIEAAKYRNNHLSPAGRFAPRYLSYFRQYHVPTHDQDNTFGISMEQFLENSCHSLPKGIADARMREMFDCCFLPRERARFYALAYLIKDPSPLDKTLMSRYLPILAESYEAERTTFLPFKQELCNQLSAKNWPLPSNANDLVLEFVGDLLPLEEIIKQVEEEYQKKQDPC